MLTELHYLPNIRYMRQLAMADEVFIEQWEHYQKGSYRNRAHIVGGNGLQRLSIPLLKGKNEQQSIREVRIAWYQNWAKQHWNSIASAYGKSPFFEYYADDLRPIYEGKPEFLFDFNLRILEVLLELMGLEVSLKFTAQYDAPTEAGVADRRNTISPKNPADDGLRYGQVFEERHGFVPDLSVLDLLFCVGPEAGDLLYYNQKE